jgi:hypothetical protein
VAAALAQCTSLQSYARQDNSGASCTLHTRLREQLQQIELLEQTAAAAAPQQRFEGAWGGGSRSGGGEREGGEEAGGYTLYATPTARDARGGMRSSSAFTLPSCREVVEEDEVRVDDEAEDADAGRSVACLKAKELVDRQWLGLSLYLFTHKHTHTDSLTHSLTHTDTHEHTYTHKHTHAHA